MILRAITPGDNAAMAHVIRTVMPEFNCVGENFSITDPEVDDMAGAYSLERHAFFVVTDAGTLASPYFVLDKLNGAADAGAMDVKAAKVLGGAGFAPLTGGDGTVCELRKMYVLREGRGRGAGRLLMNACLAGAKAAGFTHIYLETVMAMEDAAAVYQKNGFKYLDGPMGNTGHGGCDRWMIREL